MSLCHRKTEEETYSQPESRREEYMTVFINGKQRQIKRPPTIDGMDAEEFMRRDAYPIWQHQNEMWEYAYQNEDKNDEDQI
ncbi:MAG: hypothetical protein ISS70_25820 [Phycisphaerae bacterium]|nr:hypothetical protein [Phycisphaerae bacterium]